MGERPITEADDLAVMVLRRAAALARFGEQCRSKGAWRALNTVEADGVRLADDVLALVDWLNSEGFLPSHWAATVAATRSRGGSHAHPERDAPDQP